MRWARHTWDLTTLDASATLPMPYRLRMASPAEEKEVLRVVLEAYGADPVWRPQLAAIAKRMEERIRTTIGAAGCAYLLAERAGVTIAASGVAERHWTDQNLLTGICVAPSDQRRGVGRALLAQSLIWLRDRGLHQARVYTEEGSIADTKIYPLFGSLREAGVKYPAAQSE